MNVKSLINKGKCYIKIYKRLKNELKGRAWNVFESFDRF